MLDSRGVTTNSASGTPFSISIPAPGPQSYVVIVIGALSTTAVTTSIVPNVPSGAPGTFVQVAAINSANRRLEIWVGYGFSPSAPATQVAITRSAAATVITLARIFDLLSTGSTAPTVAASGGNTATSVTPDTGLLTPKVGDLLLAAFVQSGTAASTVRTHTGLAYTFNSTTTNFSNLSIELDYVEAASAVASKETWTVNTSAEWAAIQAAITPPAPPTPATVLLLKGKTTQALDTASAY